MARKKILGKISKKYWATPSKYVDILENERKVLNLKWKEEVMMTPTIVPDYIAKTAEKVLKYKPTALVAIDRKGILATRLVQHYIKRKTGKTYPVYIVKPGKRQIFTQGGLYDKTRTSSAKLLNHHQMKKLKSEKKLAIVDDIIGEGDTIKNVKKFLDEEISLPKRQIKGFPLASSFKDNVSVLYYGTRALSPTHATKEKRHLSEEETEKARHKRFADYLVYKDTLDDYMTTHRIGKEPRKSKQKRK